MMKSLNAIRIVTYPRKFLAFLIICLLVASISIAVPARQVAVADQRCAGTWSNLAWSEKSQNIEGGVYTGRNGFAVVAFDWAADQSATNGDSIQFILPPQLEASSKENFDLYNAEGVKVAEGRWNGKTLTIVFTNFVDERFKVRGRAEVSVQWDRGGISTQHGFDGALKFSGCGHGELPGRYEADSPGGILHGSGKTGIYRDPVAIPLENGGFKNIYPIDWAVYIDGTTKGSDSYGGFVVEDTAPDGYQFACDNKYNRGNFPFALKYRSSWGERADTILDSSRVERRGTYHGFTPPRNDNGIGFSVECSAKKIKVQFPYGIHPDIAPFLEIRTFSERKPIPLSTVTNTVKINEKEYSASVQIPGSIGFGTGELGGFTLKKVVVGTPPQGKKEFDFKYSCIGNGRAKEGELKVNSDGNYVHVFDLEKGLTCSVTEKKSDIPGTEPPNLTWQVNGEERDSAVFDTKEKKRTSD